MTQRVDPDDRVPAVPPRRSPSPVERVPGASWLSRLRDRVAPTQYIDGSDLPAEPESPYRARLTVPKEQVPDDVEIGEREVVSGRMRVVYEVRCACGRRWFNPRLENVQLCPRCGRAVLLRDPAQES